MKFIDRKLVEEVGKNICGVLALFIFVITLLQIILRIFLGVPLPWVFELVSICAIYLAFIGASIVILSDKATKFGLVFENLPSNIRKVISIFIRITSVLMGCTVSYSAFVYEKILGFYKMTNLPISARISAYPIIFLGICLIWKGVEKEKKEG